MMPAMRPDGGRFLDLTIIARNPQVENVEIVPLLCDAARAAHAAWQRGRTAEGVPVNVLVARTCGFEDEFPKRKPTVRPRRCLTCGAAWAAHDVPQFVPVPAVTVLASLHLLVEA